MVPSSSTADSARVITLRDVAERCGVSKQTVSKALIGDRLNVSQETIERIGLVAREMGYDRACHHAARRLALRKLGQDVLNECVAVFFPHDFFRFSYFNLIFRGILEATAEKKYALLTTYYVSESHILPANFKRGEVDGVVILPWDVNIDPLLKQLRDQVSSGSRPIVSVIQPLDGCSNVLTDDWAGGYAAASHLLDLGHRHIMQFCSDNDILAVVQRLRGYRQAFIDRGLDPKKNLHYFPWNSSLRIEEGILDEIREHPEITAILARNDVVAGYSAHVLRQGGLRVPEDISIVGFDDCEPLLDLQRNNMLTTVRLPLEDVGREAVRLLIRRTTGQATEDETIVLPTELVVRSSTAPPRKKKQLTNAQGHGIFGL